ncbi:hypothetical protein MVEN_02041100 [Mycena venus]|uniref:Uncharacterized protein n=1 Tax=Mycena venus TaxID=2733690 RepID=A0A8H6XBS7_9AGAR|nr:hypothetical protein MVEN_02041100 [Mycena venus]
MDIVDQGYASLRINALKVGSRILRRPPLVLTQYLPVLFPATSLATGLVVCLSPSFASPVPPCRLFAVLYRRRASDLPPYALQSPALGPRTHGSGHRRSTGSETNGRRILADIEWWRVADGQRDVVSEQELEEQELDPDQEDDLPPNQVAAVPVPGGAGGELGVERLSTLAHWAPHVPGPQEMPVSEMAALSLAPVTPRRHAHESSSSSLESTPEVSSVQAEHPHLDLGALSFSLQDTDAPVPIVTRARSGTLPPLLTVRAHSFADFASHERQYADFAMSPLSSHPVFSN